MADTRHFDVVVIGGGSGLTAAYHAERDGKSVALVDAQPEALGGTCVNFGCLPTKGLIQSARIVNALRAGPVHGVHVTPSDIWVDFPRIAARVREERARRASGARSYVEGSLFPFYGRARFVDEKTLEMDDGRRLSGDRVFIAAGARAAVPPVAGIEDVPYHTNESILELSARPDRLIILGGGYIGCEFAHFFEAMGTQVVLVDRAACLLREDDEVRDLVTTELGKKLRLITQATAQRAYADGRGLALDLDTKDGPTTVRGDALLLAAGRRSNAETLDASRTGVELDEAGWVRVDDQLRTTHPDIFAFGDVIGTEMYKHTSSYEGELAYRNAFGAAHKVSYRSNPHAVFTDPEIGAVGLTERACREQGIPYRAGKVDYASIAKGQIVGSPPGFAKLLVEDGTERILGCHIAGPQAAELVHEVVVAMNAEAAGVDLVRRSIHTHPTLSELVHAVFVRA